MHSRVYQIEAVNNSLKQKIDLSYELEKCGFVGEVADYALNIDKTYEDGQNVYISAIKWFKDYIEKRLGSLVIFYDDNSFEFSAGFKLKWFKDVFEDFKSIINNISLDDFANSGILLCKMQSMLETKFEFYIYSNDNGCYTLDNFIREDASDHVRYYISNIADYHF